MPLTREEDFFKKYINFTLFTPKLPPLGVWGSWNLQFLVSLHYILNLVKIGQVFLENKMLTQERTTDDERRWTQTHSNRSAELLRWPKICNIFIDINDPRMLIKIHQNNHERKYLVLAIKTHIIQGPRSKSIREKKKSRQVKTTHRITVRQVKIFQDR